MFTQEYPVSFAPWHFLQLQIPAVFHLRELSLAMRRALRQMRALWSLEALRNFGRSNGEGECGYGRD